MTARIGSLSLSILHNLDLFLKHPLRQRTQHRHRHNLLPLLLVHDRRHRHRRRRRRCRRRRWHLLVLHAARLCQVVDGRKAAERRLESLGGRRHAGSMPVSQIQSPQDRSTLTSEHSLPRHHRVAAVCAANGKAERSTAVSPPPPHHLPPPSSFPQCPASARDIELPCQSSHSLRYFVLIDRKAQRQTHAPENLERSVNSYSLRVTK